MSGEITVADWAAIVAAAAAFVAASAAIASFVLSKRIYDEIKSDEAVIAGPPHRVGLIQRDHDAPLMRVTLFNRSRRKAFVTKVEILDKKGETIPSNWSNSISANGNIENPTGLLGLVNSENLYIRRNDSQELGSVSVRIRHSFSSNDLLLQFDPYSG